MPEGPVLSSPPARPGPIVIVMALTLRHLNRATLARQMLLARESVSVEDATRRIVAIQAQEPASPYVALWNRVDGLDPAEVDAAFAERSLVKASLMRITLHAVHRDDYAAFHTAMLPNLRASRLNDRRFTSEDLTPADADATLPALLEFASEARTSAEMEAFVATQGADPAKWVWWALKTFAPLVHAVTGPPWSFGYRPSFEAAPADERPPTEEGLEHLVERYLAAFGPATPKDIGQFALQKQAPIRAALTSVSDRLVQLKGPDGKPVYDIVGGVIPDADMPAPPRLLAMWDSILLAYADRSRIIPEPFRAEVIRRNGDTLPTVLVDGRVAGVWRPRRDGIEVSAFHPLSAEDWDALEGEASALVGFLIERDPEAYSRYRRWWAQLDPAEVRVLGA